MPKLALPLTDLRIKAAKPKEKTYQLADGEGMYLEILTSGSKVWRMAYRQENRTTSTRLTFGHYPAVGLAEARRKRADTKKQIAEGIDPAQARRVEKSMSATHCWPGFINTSTQCEGAACGERATRTSVARRLPRQGAR